MRHFFKKGTDIELKQIVAKMSKSLKNVVKSIVVPGKLVNIVVK